jgi:hypothetical protein
MNLTDNEIIKAVEDFAEQLNGAISFVATARGAKEYYETLTNALDLINRLEADNSRLQAERDKAIKDFTEFAQTAFENPFACKYCKYSVKGRACLWKAEHEESCIGRYFEYKEAGE